MLADTNILIYAINKDSEKHALAKKFLRENTGIIVFSHQNIFEAIRVITHPKFSKRISAREAARAVQDITDAFRIICPDNRSEMIALEFIKRFEIVGNHVF